MNICLNYTTRSDLHIVLNQANHSYSQILEYIHWLSLNASTCCEIPFLIIELSHDSFPRHQLHKLLLVFSKNMRPMHVLDLTILPDPIFAFLVPYV